VHGDLGPDVTLEPLDDAVDHIRGSPAERTILQYGDYECPYSRRAFREIQRVVEPQLAGPVRFAFRHYPLTQIHPHAASAAAAAEAAAGEGVFWEMHELLYAHQKALEDEDLRRYARMLDLDVDRFDRGRISAPVLRRVSRDIESGIKTGQVAGTPTLFVDGVLYEGAYDAATLLDLLMS
jgi:protein-disulfide isomerase